ncbi:MAG: hypothetical protein Fur0010_22960 [Bdellovibrio sp.]
MLELSASKKSALINYGRLEGLKLGDWGILYLQDKSEGENRPKLIKVAKAEVIKVHPDRSYWFLREVDSYRYLEPGVRLLLQLSSKDKRREVKLRSTQRVLAPNSSTGRPVPKELIRDENVRIAGPEQNITSVLKREDYQIVEEEEYSISKKPEWNAEFEQEVNSARIKDPLPKDTAKLKKQIDDDVFESTAIGATEKINNLPYGKTGLYYEIERDGLNLDPKFDSGNSVYQEMMDNERKREFVSKEAIEKIKREGPMYSASMSDQQLRKFFIQSGILEERERQMRALVERPGHDVTFRYTSNLTNHTTAEDPNFQGVNYFLSVGYEYQLGRTLPSLSSFATEVELERGVAHYDIGGINARMEEGSLKGYLHWYFWNKPSGLRKYLPYIGLGIRRGNANSFSPDLSKDYEWQFIAVPSLRFGVKYRFSSGDDRDEIVKIGFGLNFQVTSESVRHNTVNIIEDDISSSFTTAQTKFSVGLGAYF